MWEKRHSRQPVIVSEGFLTRPLCLEFIPQFLRHSSHFLPSGKYHALGFLGAPRVLRSPAPTVWGTLLPASNGPRPPRDKPYTLFQNLDLRTRTKGLTSRISNGSISTTYFVHKQQTPPGVDQIQKPESQSTKTNILNSSIVSFIEQNFYLQDLIYFIAISKSIAPPFQGIVQ